MQPISNFTLLQLKARSQVYTLLSGNSLSKRHGEGYDFSEIREYQLGDDVRKINWNITARMGRPYIKELYAVRELSVCVAALLTPSLLFGAEGRENIRLKHDLITHITMLLGYAAHHNGDLFRGVCYHGGRSHATPPTKQLYTIDTFCKELHGRDVREGQTDYAGAVTDLFAQLSRPSLLIIVGDFLQLPDLSMLSQKHEVVAVIVRHHHERDFPSIGEVLAKEPGGGTKHLYGGSRTAQSFKAALAAHDAKLAEHFGRYNIRHTVIYTDEEPLGKLARVLG